jgi:hypothetical protein
VTNPQEAWLRCWRCAARYPDRAPTLIGAAWVTLVTSDVKVQPYGRPGLRSQTARNFAGAPGDPLLGRGQPTAEAKAGAPLTCYSCGLGPFHPPLERLRAVLNEGYKEILVGASGQVHGMGAPVTPAS